ncbi:MAG: hypothetical protein WCL02_03945 [bacterium]
MILGSVLCSVTSNLTAPDKLNVIPFAPTINVWEGKKLLGSQNSPCAACLSSVIYVGGVIIPYRSHHHTIILLSLPALSIVT